jgi:predicted nucleotidyltransferase
MPASRPVVAYIQRMTTQILTRSDVQSRLAEVQTEIFLLGVKRLALFGSVQRNEARSDSDVDVLVEFLPGRKTFDQLLALGELLEGMLGHRVELVTVESLSPYLRPYIIAEAQDVLRAA